MNIHLLWLCNILPHNPILVHHIRSKREISPSKHSQLFRRGSLRIFMMYAKRYLLYFINKNILVPAIFILSTTLLFYILPKIKKYTLCNLIEQHKAMNSFLSTKWFHSMFRNENKLYIDPSERMNPFSP